MSFTIPAGGFVAIVGPSGSGKTTLMRLLLGLLTPTSGRILIDGVPLGPATLAAWRQRVGAVLQDDVLLTGSLADNISFFANRPDQPLIEQSARFARVHDEIMAMPMGYSSLVGDMGSALSSGQRQRLLLARAAYRYPDALFLDEGTANLDELNEAAISDAIGMMQVSRIVIAHRPALIERADTVLMVNNGGVRIVPNGRLGSAPAALVEAHPTPAPNADAGTQDEPATAAKAEPVAARNVDALPPDRRELAKSLRALLDLHVSRQGPSGNNGRETNDGHAVRTAPASIR